MTDEMRMTHDRLDQLIDDAARDYRTPPRVDLDAIWARVEAAHFTPEARVVPIGGRPTSRRWLRPVLGIAATLVIGVGIGRMTVPTTAPTTAPVATAAPARATEVPSPATDGTASATTTQLASLSDPLQRVTYAYVARTTLLLDSLAASKTLRGDARLAADAAQLLGTTRLLLDSPAATDPRMRALLEDLELVLAQVATLRTAPRAEDLTFIADAMTEREVVPRLRTVAASYSGY